jgi:signal peptidase
MKMQESLSTTLYIVLGIGLAFGLNLAMGIVLGTDMPVVAVESNSMVPTFYKGDLLVLQGVLPEQLEEGNIIVFFPEGKATAIVHRIVQINDDGTVQTKGDANDAQLPFEKSVSPGTIHGRSIFIVPYLGWVKIGMTDYIIPNIVWIVILAVFLYGGYKLFKGSRQNKQRYAFKSKHSNKKWRGR